MFYVVKRTIDARFLRRDDGRMEYEREAIRREVGKKLVELLTPGAMFTVSVKPLSEEVLRTGEPWAVPMLELLQEIDVRPVQVMDLVVPKYTPVEFTRPSRPSVWSRATSCVKGWWKKFREATRHE